MTPLAQIERFEQDDHGDWVAVLSCGHRQHVRHQPPWQLRPWVTSAAGREGRLGASLPCHWCRMPELPVGAAEYKRTKTFTGKTTPAGLRASHSVKAGVWGQLVVESGRVVYVIEDEEDLSFLLTPGRVGVIPPERPHHVVPDDEASFYVRFLRAPVG